jgi:hypothetical protein
LFRACDRIVEQFLGNFHPQLLFGLKIFGFVCIDLSNICLIAFESHLYSLRIEVKDSIKDDLGFFELGNSRSIFGLLCATTDAISLLSQLFLFLFAQVECIVYFEENWLTTLFASFDRLEMINKLLNISTLYE